MKLFPNFTSIPFDYLLKSWVTNYVSNLGFLTCLCWITSIENFPLEHLELKFGLSSEFFNKIPVSILLDVLFRVFRFFKASFYALASSFMTFWNFVAILTLRRTYGCHGNFCNFTCEITNYCWNFVPKFRSNLSPMILVLKWPIITFTFSLLNDRPLL